MTYKFFILKFDQHIFLKLVHQFLQFVQQFLQFVQQILQVSIQNFGLQEKVFFDPFLCFKATKSHFYPLPPANHPSTKFPPPPAKFPPSPFIAPALSSSFSNFNFRSLWDLIPGPLGLQSSLLTTGPILPTDSD